jgi:hypothetical protein
MILRILGLIFVTIILAAKMYVSTNGGRVWNTSDIVFVAFMGIFILFALAWNVFVVPGQEAKSQNKSRILNAEQSLPYILSKLQQGIPLDQNEMVWVKYYSDLYKNQKEQASILGTFAPIEWKFVFDILNSINVRITQQGFHSLHPIERDWVAHISDLSLVPGSDLSESEFQVAMAAMQDPTGYNFLTLRNSQMAAMNMNKKMSQILESSKTTAGWSRVSGMKDMLDHFQK